jgi:hypothetical protein
VGGVGGVGDSHCKIGNHQRNLAQSSRLTYALNHTWDLASFAIYIPSHGRKVQGELKRKGKERREEGGRIIEEKERLETELENHSQSKSHRASECGGVRE